MRLSARLGLLGALAVVVGSAACGSGDGIIVGAEDGGGVDATADASTDAGGGKDATPPPPDDATVPLPELDASLDIGFPDVFTVPDSSSGSDSSVSVDGGCSPPGITCNGAVATTCANGVSSSTNCALQAKTCADGFGCVTCAPGTGSCNGSTGTLCKSDGTGYVTNTCDPLMGLSCNAGVCTGACANVGQSYIGCEYYGVTMTNHLLDQATFFYSISVANQGGSAATVTVTGGALGAPLTQVVAAGAIAEIKLPWVPNLSTSLLSRKETNAAYRIRSTQPVTVYQFNPRDYTRSGINSYTNDASLLIPVNALTGNYRVISFNSFYDRPGQVIVVGTQNGTTVTVTPSPTATFNAGGGIAANGGTITLNQGDVLQVGTPGPGTTAYGADMSGATVVANQPVEVLGGNPCLNVDASQGYCDHVEEIVFPLETLGKEYLVALPYNENGTPQQFVKIVGTAASTALTFDPPAGYTPAPPAIIGAGQVVTFETTQHFKVTGSQRIIVGQYLEGSTNFPGATVSTRGDPAMTVAVATAQFRTQYPFVAPSNYQQNWVNVIAPNSAVVQVDGNNVAGFVAIGASGYSVARYQLCGASAVNCTGTHVATGAQPFGIQVYGYGQDTSYAYPGGLDLKR